MIGDNMSEEKMGGVSQIKSLEMNPGSKKLYFTETKKHSKAKLNNVKPTASLNTKTGVLYLGVGAVRTLAIANQFYKIFHDAGNKVIGFRMMSALSNKEYKNGWRVAKPNKRSGMVPMSVKPALNEMLGLKQSSYKKLEVKRYKDYQSKMDDNTYYYVELK